MAMELGGGQKQFQKGVAFSKDWKSSRSGFVRGRGSGPRPWVRSEAIGQVGQHPALC